ncbi:MAG: bifunctional GNAT family N-acetyltransferase/acetate--CoA ligase family protein [Acidimicrobiales bacterium]|nr:bifunctional GNAT family N-acetyltransferase/acetate--CoA ligase family protein [Acidimicrobiales bacterium]
MPDAGAGDAVADRFPPDYPKHWELDAVLADGGTVHIRPVLPADAPGVVAFHERQSPESIYFRFFSPHPRLSQREIERMTVVDYAERMVFVALIGDEIVGMAGYDVWRSQAEADCWFLIDDEQRGRGLATILLEYLAAAAREAGLRALTAQVLPTNRRMLSVFRSAGFSTESSFEDGVIEVRLGIEPTPEALAAIHERERLAEARSVERLLAPSSVAVIGASSRRVNVGRTVFVNLLRNGFKGVAYPVNARAAPVASVRSYADVREIPDDIDLAVIAVPALRVLDVVEACGRRRVGGLIIVSAGFSEYGPYGDAGERLIVERARRYGMRVIGPESLGVINTAPRTAMHATVTGVEVRPGPVGFLTQSGTLGIAALEHAHRMGVGISSFIDVGSKVDVSGNDLLQYWEQDDRTKVIALHLESFGNPRKFTRLARRIARTKPIVAVQTHGHVVPDKRGSDPELEWPVQATVEALLAQSGVIRVETPRELFAVAGVLAVQPPPIGRRVAVLSNSRGATLLTLDALGASRLTVAELSANTRGELSALLPRGAATANPVDLTFAASPDDYEAGLRLLLADDGVDACIVIYAPAISERADEVARAIGRATVGSPRKPILATVLGRDVADTLVSGDVSIPLFEFPAEAVAVLAGMVSYGEWRARAQGRVPGPGEVDGLDIDVLRRRCHDVLDGHPDGRWLTIDEAAELLASVGAEFLAYRVVADRAGLADAAAEVGFPLVLKATGLSRPRPGEAGGVALGLRDADDLLAAYDRMVGVHGAAMKPAIVQRMAEPGVEVMVAFHQHGNYGAVVTLGLGGPTTEANPQLPVRILPLSDLDARSLIDDTPVAGLLAGREDGEKVASVLTDFLVRVAAAIEQVPEIADFVLNPVFVDQHHASVANVRVRVAPYHWEPSPSVRKLA